MSAIGTVPSALRFSGVSKRFGATQALQELSLDVPRGSIFGLVGPNGAGKTTAFSIACGFLQPDTGAVEILGGGGFDARRLKGRVLALPQDAALGRETRCLEALVFLARLQGLGADAAAANARSMLEAVGLADKAAAKTRTLSHGMLRRLQVAQALLGEAELILLDEPTSGLDPRHAHELRALIRARRGARTFVVSSHNLPELETLCDHVALIDKGTTVAAGSMDAITGRAQEIHVVLAEGPAPIDATARALDDARVAFDAATRTLSIAFAAGRPPEDVVTAALRALLDGGARVAEVRRGATLEKKFLDLT